MTRTVTLSGPARRDLGRMDRRIAARVIDAIDQYAENERGDIRRLRGTDREWRLRMGDWRIKVTFDEANNTMIVLRVLPRGRAYRR